MDIRKMLEHQMGLYEEHNNCELEEGLGTAIFQRDRRTFIDSTGGPVTVGSVKLHRLDCGHIVGSAGSQELLGTCQQCGSSICFRCGLRCVRCLKLLCQSCVKLWKREPYCITCRSVTWLKRGSLYFLRRMHEGLSS